MLEILSRYKNKPYKCGVNDCNIMLLELTGFDTSSIEPFDNLREGRKSLTKATATNSSQEYLERIGYQKINPLLISDGCILIKRIHCFVYFDGKVFGVNGSTKTFEWCSIDLTNLEKFEVFEWQK